MRTCFLLIAAVAWWVPSEAYWDDISTVIQWRRLQFAYRTETERQNDINSGAYDPDTPAPIDVDVYYPRNGQRMIFVSIPKFSTTGVPVTFGTVSNQMYQGDPLIEPFPSWEWNKHNGCSARRLVSVFRVKIDRCGLLWILDSGYTGQGIICRPQLLVFDLKQWPFNKEPYYRYEFPNAVFDRNNSIFVTPAIESRGPDCKTGAFAYVADASARAIVVTDLNREYSWRIKDVSMRPETQFSTFNIAGESFFLDDGVLGIDLSPEKGPYDNNRNLYYSALSGSKAASISTSALKNALNQPPRIYRYPSPRTSQSAAMAISRTGVAFFGLMSDITINCWNINSDDYGRYIHTVYSNPTTMQFPSGMKVVVNPAGEEELWIMTARFQKLMNDGYNFNEVNFRISKGNVNDLLANSRCTRPNY